MGTETALSTETANAFDPNKIAAEVTTAVLIEAAKSGWKKVKKFFQDQDVKDSIDYGDAYSDYLQNTINKNSKIKTLIYRRVPKDLYSFYECVSVIYNNNKIDTSNAQNVLNISNKLIVTGTGGIGKSLLLKHLFLNVAQQGTYIPVLIELRKFNQLENKEISLYQAVYQTLSDNGLPLEDEYYSYSLNEGGILFFWMVSMKSIGLSWRKFQKKFVISAVTTIKIILLYLPDPRITSLDGMIFMNYPFAV